MEQNEDHRPIVFAKFDRREGQESLTLIIRPDRSTTKNEECRVIPAHALDQEAPQAIEEFAQSASVILAKQWETEKFKPVELLKIEENDPPYSTN